MILIISFLRTKNFLKYENYFLSQIMFLVTSWSHANIFEIKKSLSSEKFLLVK